MDINGKHAQALAAQLDPWAWEDAREAETGEPIVRVRIPSLNAACDRLEARLCELGLESTDDLPEFR
jgi:hypothetical protein